jgi:hypothetical protein
MALSYVKGDLIVHRLHGAYYDVESVREIGIVRIKFEYIRS